MKISESAQSNETPPDLASKKHLPLTVWIMGFVMLLMNTSYTMIYSLSAVYLLNVIGMSSGRIGMLDNIAEGASYGAKLFSGVFSDYFRRRKIIVILGYALMVFSRPIIAVYSTFEAVFASRFMERVGNGIQATPRDALISDVAPPNKKGECFGLMRSIGIVGSFLGSVLGGFLMYWTMNNYRLIFWLATIPAIFALCMLIFAIKEPDEHIHPKDHQPRHPLHFSDIPRLGKSYWLLMLVVAVFMVARVSETFLVLHANKNFGLPEDKVPLVMMLFNLTYFMSAYPIGRLSDRMGRYSLLTLSFGMLIVASLLLWQAQSLIAVFIGILFWGLQMGMTQSLFMALIADMAPEDLRGTAFGFFYLISAISSVLCGITAHVLSDSFGESTLFLTVGTVGFIALLLTVWIAPRKKQKNLSLV